MREKLADRYRPARFEEVIGQERTVKILSALVLANRRAEDLLLFGAVGSGKTSLVRIYGRALNCLEPNPANGSPCGTCLECTRSDDEGQQKLFVEYNVPLRPSSARLQEFLDIWLSAAVPAGRRLVLFFDEAHAFTPEASDLLLKFIEDHADHLVFCFATTEPERLRPALRSRLMQLEVRALTVAEATRLLTSICHKEGINIDPAALALFTAVADRFPRDLLTALDAMHIAAADRITVELVKELLSLDYLDAVPGYFIALAEGKLDLAAQIFADWPDPVSEKIAWVQAFLTSIYYSDVMGTAALTDPRIAAISSPKRQAVVTAMVRHFGADSPADLGDEWLKMLSIWQTERAATEEAMLVALARFHAQFIARLPTKSSERRVACAHSVSSAPTVETAGSGRTISRADVRAILNGASALVQRTGVTFDVALEFSQTADSDAGLADRLAAALCAYARSSAWGHEHAAFIRLTERYGDSLKTRMVLAAFGEAAAESEDRRQQIIRAGVEAWFASQALKAPRLALRVHHGRSRANSFHWDEVLRLCRSMDEAWEGRDRTGQPVALHRLLGIASADLLEPNPLLTGHVLALSAQLLKADGDEDELRLAPLSAFDDRAWDHIGKGWEGDEHLDRVMLQQQRRQELDTLRAQCGDDMLGYAKRAEELVATWSADPKHRPRNWLGWWI